MLHESPESEILAGRCNAIRFPESVFRPRVADIARKGLHTTPVALLI